MRLEPSADSERAFIAHWRLSGHLKLPWRPAIKPYAGATLYEMDDDGLISSHTEAWSITAFDAFASTLPNFGADAAPRVSEHRFVELPERPAIFLKRDGGRRRHGTRLGRRPASNVPRRRWYCRTIYSRENQQ